MIRAFIIYSLLSIGFNTYAQNKEIPKDQKHIYSGNKELEQNNFVNAEAAYRNAISENPTNAVSKFNLGNAYFKNNKTKEALTRYYQAQKVAATKAAKHKAFHNIGNSYMQQKDYNKAIEAYKNALRNNPNDDESRYNLALAKKMKEEQDKEDEKNKDKQDKNKDQDNKDKDKNKDNQDKNDQDSDKKDDKGDQEDKEDADKDGDEEKDKKQDDEGQQDKDKEQQNEQQQNDADKKKEEQPKQPQPGQLSPEQVQSLLDAMNNEEKKLQEKMNAKKAKGVPVKTEKDW